MGAELVITSTRVKFGTIAFTSLIILGLEAASKDSSLTVKIVFSFGFSWFRKEMSFSYYGSVFENGRGFFWGGERGGWGRGIEH
jgi:hypothetical protein